MIGKKKLAQYLKQFPYLNYLLRALLQPRTFQVYCIGAPKTGTHSIYEIFRASYRAMHEPCYHELADLLVCRRDGTTTDDELRRVFKRRDWTLWQECESSHSMAWFADILCDISSDARFILTVRDCYSWLDSITNQHLNYRWGPSSAKLRGLYFGEMDDPDFKEVDRLDIYSIHGYLSYWAKHNDFILSTIPEDRLLIIPTHRIRDRLDEVAEFVGVDRATLDTDHVHSYRAPRKHHVLERLDPVAVKEEIESTCGRVIERLYESGNFDGYDLVGVPAETLVPPLQVRA